MSTRYWNNFNKDNNDAPSVDLEITLFSEAVIWVHEAARLHACHFQTFGLRGYGTTMIRCLWWGSEMFAIKGTNHGID